MLHVSKNLKNGNKRELIARLLASVLHAASSRLLRAKTTAAPPLQHLRIAEQAHVSAR